MRRRSVIAVLVCGALVAVAPFVWYGIVFTDPLAPAPAGFDQKAAAALFALPGFVTLALFRRSDMVSVAGCVVAFLAVASVVVALQYVTIDPNDTSSTASLGFVFEAFWGCVAAAGFAALDGIARAIVRRVRA